jgi:PleD family two-component response regulator
MSLQGKKAIVISYSYRSALVVETLLQVAGATVKDVFSPEQIVQIANQDDWDLVAAVVDDMQVFRDEPQYEVYDLCDFVAFIKGARDHLRDVPFLIVGWNELTEAETACVQAANIAYFKGPVDRRVFDATVERLLG